MERCLYENRNSTLHRREQVIEGFLLDINQAGKSYAWAALRLPQGYNKHHFAVSPSQARELAKHLNQFADQHIGVEDNG